MIRDRTNWPPKCHGYELRSVDVEWAGPSDLVKKFNAVADELELKDPFYCAEPRCSALLDPDSIVDGLSVVLCEKCKTLTCKNCRQSHGPDPQDCKGASIDPDLQKAFEEGNWKRCPSCGRMIEKQDGCDLLR